MEQVDNSILHFKLRLVGKLQRIKEGFDKGLNGSEDQSLKNFN